MLIKVNAWTSTSVGATGNFGPVTRDSIEKFKEWCKAKWEKVKRTSLGNKYAYHESIKVTGEVNKDTLYQLQENKKKNIK